MPAHDDIACQLGIDTGGTYTDAVLLGRDCRVLGKSKSLTTPWDLALGIAAALDGLPSGRLAAVQLVGLSTTLSTNSVVEGRGAPICVLLPGYDALQVEKSGLLDIVPAEYIHRIPGGHDATGNPLEALDLEAAQEIIRRQSKSVSAFAVSALFGARNSEHELSLRKLVRRLTRRPVACGHELSGALGAPRRALTVALNARMIFHIQALIDAVRLILKQRRIEAPLMLVKGDGSLVNADTALNQPVTTVLSGPAASVIGAGALSGRQNALIVDMGGTTTDIALVRDGRPEISPEGARVGDWRPMVEAAQVFSAGLGGDSEVRFNGKPFLSGRRVLPVSLLAQQYPEVLEALERQSRQTPSPRHNHFALRLHGDAVLLERLSPIEREIREQLTEGPLELEGLGQRGARAELRAIARLERMGLAIYSGLTPSDAAHALDLCSHWSAEGARLGVRLWLRQMRHLYGYGNGLADEEEASRLIFRMVVEALSRKLLEAALNARALRGKWSLEAAGALLTELLVEPPPDAPEVFRIRFAENLPLVAVGGPARDYFPSVAERLGMTLDLPEHGEVANAVGAVLGAVVQTARITITQPEFGRFVLFHRDRPLKFEALDAALARARQLARREALARARAAGATAIEVGVREERQQAAEGADIVFVGATVTAVASGRPAAAPAAEG